MSVTYKDGVDYLKSYTGLLKCAEAVLQVILIILAAVLGNNFQIQFLCGVSIYGLFSTVVLLIFHFRGISHTEIPLFWVECFNSGLMSLLLLVSSCFVISVLSKWYVVTGIIGFVTIMVYTLDGLENFTYARTPRAHYVWTTPNMPE